MVLTLSSPTIYLTWIFFAFFFGTTSSNVLQVTSWPVDNYILMLVSGMLSPIYIMRLILNINAYSLNCAGIAKFRQWCRWSAVGDVCTGILVPLVKQICKCRVAYRYIVLVALLFCLTPHCSNWQLTPSTCTCEVSCRFPPWPIADHVMTVHVCPNHTVMCTISAHAAFCHQALKSDSVVFASFFRFFSTTVPSSLSKVRFLYREKMVLLNWDLMNIWGKSNSATCEYHAHAIGMCIEQNYPCQVS